MCMYIYIIIYIYTHTYVYIYIYIYIHIHTQRCDRHVYNLSVTLFLFTHLIYHVDFCNSKDALCDYAKVNNTIFAAEPSWVRCVASRYLRSAKGDASREWVTTIALGDSRCIIDNIICMHLQVYCVYIYIISYAQSVISLYIYIYIYTDCHIILHFF